jgi:ribose 5-phosphate isomerase RpiB
MNSLEQQIDELVRKVLARVKSEQPVTKTDAKKTESSDKPTNVLPFRVLGMKELESIGSIGSQVTVKRDTVITPAAKEWLKAKKIELRWGTGVGSNEKSKAGTSAPQIVLGQTVKSFNAANLVQQLKQRGHATEQLASTGLKTLVEELAHSVARSGAIAVLVTDQTWNATVLANRHNGVNAAHCKDRIDAANAMKQVKVNFLIVNPVAQSSHSLINMIHELTK